MLCPKRADREEGSHGCNRYPNRARFGGLRVALIGPPDAERTLLVFNGIGASLETVAPFVEHFRRTRILTFDVPGVGGSPRRGYPTA